MKKKLRAPLILASASPRRQLLLSQAGYDFEVVATDIDETAYLSSGIEPGEYAKLLAKEKASAVACRRRNTIVIGADTIVYAGGRIIGKAADDDHAKQIIRTLFSSPHDVITGIAILKLDEDIEIVESITTVVYPRMLSEEQIDDHIRKGDWQGKAGAYGIQETGDEFVERIEGSLTNVMGFPMERITQLLDGRFS